ISPAYEFAWAFQDGVARVQQAGLFGFVGRDGTNVLPPQFATATLFSDGRAFASMPGTTRLSLIDKLGNTLTPARFDTASEFAEALAAASENGRWGYIDRDGEWKIEPRFSFADRF